MDDPTKMVFKIRNMVIFVTVGINTVSKKKAQCVFENATFRQPEVQDPRPARRDRRGTAYLYLLDGKDGTDPSKQNHINNIQFNKEENGKSIQHVTNNLTL